MPERGACASPKARRPLGALSPHDVREIELINLDELHLIRHIWVSEKHEHEDLLPTIYEEATGDPFPGQTKYDDQFPFDTEDLAELRELSRSDLQYELLRELVSVEHSHRVAARRSGIWGDIDTAFNRSGFSSADEAIDLVRALTRGRQSVGAGLPVDFGTTLTEVIEDGPADEST